MNASNCEASHWTQQKTNIYLIREKLQEYDQVFAEDRNKKQLPYKEGERRNLYTQSEVKLTKMVNLKPGEVIAFKQNEEDRDHSFGGNLYLP